MKKDFTEAGYIEDAITRIALINKDISIKLINSGKTVIQTNGSGDSKSVIYSIYGKDIANGIMDVDYTYEDMVVTGVVGKSEIARNNRSHQIFFVNNRYVKDKNLTAAVDQAYKGLVPGGKYGFVILNISIDPKKVDVNVHPAKLEVRFEEDGKVFKAVYHAIKSGLDKGELIENIERPINIDKKEEIEEEKQEKTQEFKPRENTFSGFFKKLMKEPEETKEELENNSLKEIFEYRKHAKESIFKGKHDEIEKIPAMQLETSKSENIIEEQLETISVPVAVSAELVSSEISGITENIDNKIEEVEEPKEVKIGSTIISSDTKELNFDVTDVMSKDETVKLENVKSIVDIDAQKTEVINIVKDDKEDLKESIDVQKEESKNNEISNKPIDNVTEKLLKIKMEADIDDTQLIDTAKVREAIKESNVPITKEFENMYKQVFGMDVSSVRKTKEEEEAKINVSASLKFANSENMSVFEDKSTYVPEVKYKFIGIVFSTYIIIEIQDEMYIIDQHAAHERIMYEKVKSNYYSELEKDSQMLLLADVITLTHKEISIARENIDMFRQAGFDFEEFGENTIKLIAVPSMCEELNTKNLFLEILDEMDTVAVTAKQEKEDKFIATVACKAAVKGNMKLDEKEVESLMKKLLSLPNPFTCPHGRPTAIKISKTDLEKKFSRR